MDYEQKLKKLQKLSVKDLDGKEVPVPSLINQGAVVCLIKRMG